MALPAGVKQMGTFQGGKGDTGSLAFATAEKVPWTAEPKVTMVGPESNRGAHFELPLPLPGPETVSNDDANEALLLNPTKTQAAVVGLIGGATTPALAKREIVVYGHSYTIEPSSHSTDGQEFFNLIAAEADTTATTHGVSSSRAVQTSWDVNGQPPGSAAPGSKLFIVDTEANDFAHRIADGSYYNAWSVNVPELFGFGVSAILARLSARAVVEQSAGTTSGTWTREEAFEATSGGTFDYTLESGAYIDIPITITAADSGVAFVSLIWMKVANGRANATISVDGTVYETITHDPVVMPEMLVSGRAIFPSGTSIASFFDPVRVDGLSIGAHTIRVTHTGLTGHRLNVDSVLIQAASPEPVVWLRDQPPVAGRDQTLAIDNAKVAIYKANKVKGNAVTDPIFAQFPNVIVIEQADYLDAGSVSTTDGLHPNDKGNARMAQRIIRELSVRGENAD